MLPSFDPFGRDDLPVAEAVCGFMCAPSDAEAIRMAEGWTFFQFALGFYNSHGPVVPNSVNLWDEYEKWKQTPAGEKAQRGGGRIGSPATLRERLRKFRDSNVDQVILLNQAGNNTHADICSSLELFAREVMPEFHADEPAHQEWKRKVLAGEIELEEIDTNVYNLPSNQTPTKKAASATA